MSALTSHTAKCQVRLKQTASGEEKQVRRGYHLVFWERQEVRLNFEWLHPVLSRSQIDTLVGSGAVKAEQVEKSQRLKSESHSNKLHSISPSPLLVLASFYFRCLFHFPSSYISLTSLFTSSGAVICSFAFFIRLRLSSFNFSVNPTILHLNVFFLLPITAFSLSAHVRWGHFVSPVSSISGIWRCVCVWLHVAQPCAQLAPFKTIFSNRVISSDAPWSRGQHWFKPVSHPTILVRPLSHACSHVFTRPACRHTHTYIWISNCDEGVFLTCRRDLRPDIRQNSWRQSVLIRHCALHIGQHTLCCILNKCCNRMKQPVPWAVPLHITKLVLISVKY